MNGIRSVLVVFVIGITLIVVAGLESMGIINVSSSWIFGFSVAAVFLSTSAILDNMFSDMPSVHNSIKFAKGVSELLFALAIASLFFIPIAVKNPNYDKLTNNLTILSTGLVIISLLKI